MQKHYKFSMWYVILGIWGVLIIQNLIASAVAIETIPYSRFLKLLKEKKITEVAISSNQLQEGASRSREPTGKGVMFRTVRVDPEISQLLEEYNVNFKGQVESTFLRDLFSWIFPIFLFVGIWYFHHQTDDGQQQGS